MNNNNIGSNTLGGHTQENNTHDSDNTRAYGKTLNNDLVSRRRLINKIFYSLDCKLSKHTISISLDSLDVGRKYSLKLIDRQEVSGLCRKGQDIKIDPDTKDIVSIKSRFISVLLGGCQVGSLATLGSKVICSVPAIGYTYPLIFVETVEEVSKDSNSKFPKLDLFNTIYLCLGNYKEAE